MSEYLSWLCWHAVAAHRDVEYNATPWVTIAVRCRLARAVPSVASRACIVTLPCTGRHHFTSARVALSGIVCCPVPLKGQADCCFIRKFIQIQIQDRKMQIFIKLYGCKRVSSMQTFVIDAEPCATISTIASMIQDGTGAPAERLTIMSGLNVCNPSCGFKKLECHGTLADHGLCHMSTLMAVVSGRGRLESTDALPADSRSKRSCICLGKCHYRTSPNQHCKTGDIMAVVGNGGKSCTTLLYQGVRYSNALEWLEKAFNNSGRACHVQIERSPSVDTPRPMRYIPPSSSCPFGQYC